MDGSKLPRRVPSTEAFFKEEEDEDFQHCLKVMQEMQDEVQAQPPERDALAGLLSHFQRDQPMTSLSKLWEDCVNETHSLAGSEPQLQQLLQCAATCSRMRHLKLRMAALEVWPSLAGSLSNLLDCLDGVLDQLLETLLANMALAEEDFLKESPEVLEDPSLVELLKCRLREGLDLEQTKRTFTARQRAALALDELAKLIKEPVLERVLPMIRLKLAEETWERRELAVLALGAVATAMTATSLQKEDVQALLSACGAPQGLLRCTALWAASRFVPLLAERQRPDSSIPLGQDLLDEMRQVFFSHLTDPNHKAKAAAASSICELFENIPEQLAQHEDWILEEMRKGIQNSCGENLPALCDSVATMLDQPATKRLKTSGGLLAELEAQLDGAADATASCIFEALAAFVPGCGEDFLAMCPKILRHAVRVIHNGLHPAPTSLAPASLPDVEDGVPDPWQIGEIVL